MSLKENRFYIYLGLIAIFSWGLVKLTGLDEEDRMLLQAHSADYFSKKYTKWEMNELGRLKTKLIADSLIHYSDDKTIHTANPVMSFYNETTPPWVIKAQTGILSADGKDLLLNGKAIVDRAEAKDATPITINTSNLRVKPEIGYAETDDWAELLSQANKTTGIGMKMTYMQPVHLELLAHVKGKYETK